MFSFYSRSHGHCKSDQGKQKQKTLQNAAQFTIEKGHHLHDLQLELDKAKLVLLVVLDAAVVGAALHVHQLAHVVDLILLAQVNLDSYQR